MEVFTSTVTDDEGNVVNGSTVTVLVKSTGLPVASASVYEPDEVTVLGNPFLSGYARSEGEIEFAVANGKYDVKIETGAETDYIRGITLADGYEVATAVDSGAVTVNFPTDADLTLSESEASNRLITITDTSVVLTTGRNVIFPTDVREWFVDNQTAQTLTCKTLAGTGKAVAAGEIFKIRGDGTNIEYAIIGDAEMGGVSVDEFRQLPPSTSGTDTYTVTTGFGALTANEVIAVNFVNSNLTTTPTIARDGLTALNIKDIDGNAVRPGDCSGVRRYLRSGTDAILLDIPHPGPTSRTPIATTSGTSHDYTTIPAWVKKITVSFAGLSTNGTSPPIVQIGDSGGIEATGYSGAGGNVSTGAQDADNYTTGFGLVSNPTAAAHVLHGAAVLTLLDSSTNTWAWAYTGAASSTAFVVFSGGSKALSATLDRLRLTTVGGTDTFDAGSFNIMYE